MAAEAILILCAQALFIQSAFGACTSRAAVDASRIGSPYGIGPLSSGFNGLAYNGLAYSGTGCGRRLAYDGYYSPAMEFTATSGGALPVTSSSAMAPVGISIQSDNVYEGALNVAGELPFVGTTAFDGVLNTAGSGAINHACGNGLNTMSALSDTSSPASVATSSGPVYSNELSCDGFYGTGLSGPGCGANAYACDAPAMACDGLTCVDGIEITPTSGGALPVASASSVPPTGIAVASDNAYEGALTVGGELPFVGTVGLEGVVPSAGAGTVNHACGNGRNAMVSENAAFGPAGAYSFGAYGPSSAFAPNAFGPGFGAAGLGYRGLARGCSCAY